VVTRGEALELVDAAGSPLDDVAQPSVFAVGGNRSLARHGAGDHDFGAELGWQAARDVGFIALVIDQRAGQRDARAITAADAA